MLLAESNYVLDVCLTRYHDCQYLLQLAGDGEIELVIPDYALAEVEAKFKALELERIRTIQAAQAVLRTLPPDSERERIFAETLEIVRQMFAGAHFLLDGLQRIAIRIPFTGEILAAARLRKTRRVPPKDVKDLEIYESILAFARLNQSPDVAFIFLERDVAHFDVPEVKAELAVFGVEIYFSAGEAVRRVRELLGK
jgi:hypothetical protein